MSNPDPLYDPLDFMEAQNITPKDPNILTKITQKFHERKAPEVNVSVRDTFITNNDEDYWMEREDASMERELDNAQRAWENRQYE
jgi:hypothetical protein